MLHNVVEIDTELRRQLMTDADRQLATVRRLHPEVHENRRRGDRLAADHTLTQHGRIFRGQIGRVVEREVVRAPSGVAALLETHEARDAIVNDAKAAAYECLVRLERVPRERNAWRDVAELILSVAGIQIVLELRNTLQNRITRPRHRVVVVHRVQFGVVTQAQRQREIGLDAPLVIDVQAGGVSGCTGDGIGGAVRIGESHGDRSGEGQRRRVRKKVERAVGVVGLVLRGRDAAEFHAELDHVRTRRVVDVHGGAIDESQVGFLEDERETRRSGDDAGVRELRSRLERRLVVIPVHDLQTGLVHKVAAFRDITLA